MSVKLEDGLTRVDIRELSAEASRQALSDRGQALSDPAYSWNEHFARRCIRLAVEKAEKVEGFVSTTRASGLVHDGHAAGWFFIDPKDPAASAPGTFRHALLLLGPKYEPKPVKTAEEKVREALNEAVAMGYTCPPEQNCRHGACRMARILRGER